MQIALIARWQRQQLLDLGTRGYAAIAPNVRGSTGSGVKRDVTLKIAAAYAERVQLRATPEGPRGS